MSQDTLLQDIQWATRIAQDAFKRAQDAVADTKREQRLKARECPTCYYLRGRIGGAAFTNSTCKGCGVTIVNPSTATDKYCAACSKEHRICRYCGADLELKNRRKV